MEPTEIAHNEDSYGTRGEAQNREAIADKGSAANREGYKYPEPLNIPMVGSPDRRIPEGLGNISNQIDKLQKKIAKFSSLEKQFQTYTNIRRGADQKEKGGNNSEASQLPPMPKQTEQVATTERLMRTAQEDKGGCAEERTAINNKKYKKVEDCGFTAPILGERRNEPKSLSYRYMAWIDEEDEDGQKKQTEIRTKSS